MDEIRIVKKRDNFFEVIQSNKRSGDLGYDEMLGLITSLTLPEPRPCLQWMKTETQHKEFNNTYYNL